MRDAVEVAQDVVVPKAEDSIAFAFKDGSPLLIGNAIGMLATIGFNDQPTLLADEVGNKWTDRLLSAKLGAIQLS